MNMREQFEAWAETHYLLKELPTDFEDGEYTEPEMQYAWESWEASRATIRVDLPYLFPFYREGVTEALLSHGVKVNQWGSK